MIASSEDTPEAYSFSVLAARLKKLPARTRKLFAREGELEDLFQVCGTIAAGGYVSGNAVSFGHPRDNDPGFYQKLDEVAQIIGEGSAQKNFTVGVSPNPKDAGVDVIAWRTCPDRAPGHLYMLGQCASGSNWPGKKPLVDYDNFHKDYWIKPPTSPRMAAFFMPYDLRQSVAQTGYTSLVEAQHWTRWRHTRDYGIIIDRFRLAHYFARGVVLGKRAALGLTIEGLDKIASIQTWIASVSDFLRN